MSVSLLRRLGGLIFDLLLVAAIALGFFFRFSWTNWNQNTDLHPDEYGLTSTLTRLQIPDTLEDYFNTRISPISPYARYDEAGNKIGDGPDNVMRWGQWPIILLKWSAVLTDNTGYTQQRLFGRQMSALADSVAVLVIVIIGWRLYSLRHGLLAGALSALAVMQIQQSHFMTSDTLALAFTALTMWMAVEVALSDGRQRWRGLTFAALFGVFGAMAVASRVNLVPLLGLIAVAAFIAVYRARRQSSAAGAEAIGLQDLLAVDWRPIVVLCAIAAAATLVTYRLVHPMSFRAETGDTTLFTLTPNPDWLNALAVSAAESSLKAGGPPAEQWTARTPIVFPWLNMVIWGMGLPLGLTAWAGLLWMAWRSLLGDRATHAPPVRPYDSARQSDGGGAAVGELETRDASTVDVGGSVVVPVVAATHTSPNAEAADASPAEVAPAASIDDDVTGPVVNEADGQMAPVYASSQKLAVAATIRPDLEWMRHALPIIWAAGMFLFMGTRAVMSVRYFLPIYPFLALCAAWALLAVWDWAAGRAHESGRALGSDRTQASPLRAALAGTLITLVLGGTAGWAYGFTNIYRTDNTRVRAARWIYQNVPGPVNVYLTDPSGSDVHIPMPLGQGVVIGDVVSTVTSFTPATSGTLTRVGVGFARNSDDGRVPGVLNVVVSSDPGGTVVLAEANLVIPALSEESDARGTPVVAAFAQPVDVQADTGYYVLLRAVSGAPLTVSGATISNENWDESLPMRLDNLDPFGGIYVGRTMEMHWPDAPNKRDMIVDNLSQVDFIILPSQRRLWSSTRIPATYPMTMEYYKALFDGRLGYELVGEFQNPIVIGPLQVSDAAGTVAWGKAPDLTPNAGDPFNSNIFAAEEAFTVYDHAPVWIFRKRADFDLAKATAILDRIDLNTVVVQGPLDASRAGTLLKLPADLLAIQRAGGTWSTMFDLNSLLNTNQPLAVIVWYLAVLALGLLALPLTQVAFKGLADGGYPLARSVGLLVVAWLAWIAGSLRVLPFTQATLWIAVLGLALVSGVIAFVRRRELEAYLRAHWKQILVVEGLALALFVGFLLVRLGNPDLWHPSKGGEKPMDFSYFNAVLRSTFFPPYDPWYAGGYLNYYYYGFVLMGVPTKLLGIMPSLAYNLILPTFYALLGLNAFSVAFNLVERSGADEVSLTGATHASPATASPTDVAPETAVAHVSPDTGSIDQAPEALIATADDETVLTAPPLATPAGVTATADVGSITVASAPSGRATHASPLRVSTRPSPYLAGFMAVLLMVVFGNLGQIYTYLSGFQRAADPNLVASAPNDAALLIANGFFRVVTGQSTMSVPLDWWYWNGSRVPGYVNGTSDFSEFPLFTFLYADPHAHLAALPFTVLVLAWGLAYLRAFVAPRKRWEWALAFVVGGLALGVLRPTNTWDYPMYLAVTVVAIGGAWLWHRRVIDGDLLLGLGLHLGLVLGLSQVFYRPFDQWFVPAYTEVKRFDGPYSDLLGYFYWYGLFLFLFGSLVVSEIGRWLSDTPATVLNRAGQWFMPVMVFLAGVLLALAALLYLDVEIGWISWPLLVLAGLLAFRDRAGMQLGKRAVLFLLGTGMAVTIFVELFTLGGDRFNTMFKLYVQVWVLFAIGAAAALAFVWADRAKWSPIWKGLHTGALAVLVVAAGLYPVTAVPAKVRDRFPPYSANPVGAGSGCDQIEGQPIPYEAGLAPEAQPHSLDGMQFMSFSAYCDNGNYLPLSYDYDAIRWMQQNVQGSPVIVEAQTFNLYVMSSRYAWYTGLPDVVGWDWHQRQQRGAIGSDIEVTLRGREVTDFYCAGAPVELLASSKYGNCANVLQYVDGGIAFVQSFLQRYAPKYIIVGPMERSYYPAEGLAKFERMTGEGQLRIAYQNPGVTIYEVVEK